MPPTSTKTLTEYWQGVKDSILELQTQLQQNNIILDDAFLKLFSSCSELARLGLTLESSWVTRLNSIRLEMNAHRPIFVGEDKWRILGESSYKLAQLYLRHVEVFLNKGIVSTSTVINMGMPLHMDIPEQEYKLLKEIIEDYESSLNKEYKTDDNVPSISLEEHLSEGHAPCLENGEEAEGDWVCLEMRNSILYMYTTHTTDQKPSHEIFNKLKLEN